MFTNFCAQFILVEILVDESCPTGLRPSTDMWAQSIVGLETSRRARAIRRISSSPILARDTSFPPCSYSARVPSPIAASAGSPPQWAPRPSLRSSRVDAAPLEGVPPAPRRTVSSTQPRYTPSQTTQSEHTRYTSSLPPSRPVFARELLPGEISRHRPPPPDPPHPEHPLDVTK